MNRRLENLRRKLVDAGVDGMVIMKPENRMYISGFSGSAGILFVTMDAAFLLTDFRYTEQAEHEAISFDVIQHGDKILDSLKQVVTDSKIHRICFEKDYISYGEFTRMETALSSQKMIPTEGIIEGLRSLKDEDEVELISEAIRIADAAFEHMCTIIQIGMSEKDAAVELEYFMRRNGSQKNSFSPIVASGPRSSLPHAQPTERTIQSGEMVKMDFGATYCGYCSDLTRTVFVGEITDKHQEIYGIVLQAQMQAIDSIVSGAKASEIDRVARSYISDHGYGDFFGHSLGHGVGLYIHESPRLSQFSDEVLQPGNIVTVEPGIYIPDWGGVRIEDMILVEKDGYSNLTKSSKELRVL